MLTTVYKVGRQVWIVPPDLVSVHLTTAIDKVNHTLYHSETSQLSEEEAFAWNAACASPDVKTVEM